MIGEAVLDASAILALLLGEPGERRVREAFPGAIASAVNLSETLAWFTRTGRAPAPVSAQLEQIRLAVLPFDAEQAQLAAGLVSVTRPHGLSFGDRACLALALPRRGRVLTADRAWARLDLDLSIELIR